MAIKVLVVKLTSMGDVLHALPAVSDLYAHQPELEVDWVVEEHFQEIPLWHPAVKRVIPIATRRWRKKSKDYNRFSEFRAFLTELRAQKYDYIVDAQGLIKSSIVSCLAKGKRIGFSGDSIKESPAAWLYQSKQVVPRGIHAVERLRRLFAQAFGYDYQNLPLDYGLAQQQESSADKPYLMFFHATTWASKHLPSRHWRELVECAGKAGFEVKLPWGNQNEHEAAQQIAEGFDHAIVLPKSNLTRLSQVTLQARGAIAVDTGLGHLAAAHGVPCVSVYGSTNPKLTGAFGENQVHFLTHFECSPCLLKQCNRLSPSIQEIPCYASAPSGEIWRKLELLLEQAN